MYQYQLLSRPAGTDTTPAAEGRVLSMDNLYEFRLPFGSVAYPEPLLPEQVKHFSLMPYTEVLGLNGRVFKETDEENGYVALIRFNVDETGPNGLAFTRTHHIHFDNSEADSFQETVAMTVANFYDFLEIIKSGDYLEVSSDTKLEISPFKS